MRKGNEKKKQDLLGNKNKIALLGIHAKYIKIAYSDVCVKRTERKKDSISWHVIMESQPEIKNSNADVNNEMKNMEQEILNESGVREKVSLNKRSYIIIFMRMVIRECSLVKIQLRVK